MVAQESAYQNQVTSPPIGSLNHPPNSSSFHQVQELHRLVRQQKEIFSQLPGGSMLDVDLNAMPVADSLGEPPVTPKFHLASKRGRELTIIPEASLLFQRPSTPNYPPGFTPNSSNLPLRRALSDCHVAQRPMLTRIPPVAPTQVPDFPQFPPPPVYPSSSPWPSQAQFPSNPYLPPSPAPQVVPWQPNPLWYHQMMPSPAGYNPPPIQPSFQPSFGASPMWPQSHPSAYSERPILSSSFPPSALEPPPPPPPRPAFRQPPPMVLVREKGSRTLKLVSAEEHYGDGRTAGPTSTSPSAAGQSTVSPIIRRRQGEHLQAQLTSGVSDERESLREDRGDVIDPVVIDLPHRPITMPHELQAAAPVRPLARRPDSSAGGQIQEKALQRVLEQLELPQGRGRS